MNAMAVRRDWIHQDNKEPQTMVAHKREKKSEMKEYEADTNKGACRGQPNKQLTLSVQQAGITTLDTQDTLTAL